MFLGEFHGWTTALPMSFTARRPKLVPSSHASRWTRNHAPCSPVWWARKSWNEIQPTGASRGASSDFHSRRSDDGHG